MHPIDAQNLEFYEQVASRFSRSRQRPWRGWESLTLPESPTVRVLDAGCGNGRLYAHLSARCPGALFYVGADFSPSLLAAAKARTEADRRPQDTIQWLEMDLHALPPATSAPYHRIYLFGVLHHVAGRGRREALLRQLGARLAPEGELWVTAWRFADDPSYEPPRTDNPSFCVTEDGARWLSFDGVGRRYCVSVDLDEIDAYPRTCGLTELRRFRADGRTGRMNIYLIYGHST